MQFKTSKTRNINLLTTRNMKKGHYILNTVTDQNFDTLEMKFYNNNWEPALEDDKNYLQSLIDSDSEKFANCIIETKTF